MADIGMLKKLDEVETKYTEIENSLNQPNLSPDDIKKFSMERSELEEIVDTYREFKKTVQNIEENKLLLDDKELSELVKEENTVLEVKKEELERKWRIIFSSLLVKNIRL